MINADYATFQLAPKALDTIRMITAFDIFAFMVVHYFMHIVFRQTFVTIPAIGNNRSSFWHK